ncbi:hypothetical protein ES702_01471 [subsurface metagenome]
MAGVLALDRHWYGLRVASENDPLAVCFTGHLLVESIC